MNSILDLSTWIPMSADCWRVTCASDLRALGGLLLMFLRAHREGHLLQSGPAVPQRDHTSGAFPLHLVEPAFQICLVCSHLFISWSACGTVTGSGTSVPV